MNASTMHVIKEDGWYCVYDGDECIDGFKDESDAYLFMLSQRLGLSCPKVGATDTVLKGQDEN